MANGLSYSCREPCVVQHDLYSLRCETKHGALHTTGYPQSAHFALAWRPSQWPLQRNSAIRYLIHMLL